jgi:hypothetical protein
MKLARQAASLGCRTHQKRWPESSLAAVEQELFIAGYIVRKLLDANKLSDEVESITLHAMRSTRTGRIPDLMNWHHIDKFYDLACPVAVNVGLRCFCDQLIHSFIFVVDASSSGLKGFHVASDRERSSGLLRFDIQEVVDVMQRVADDDVVESESIRDESGQWMVVRKSNRISAAETAAAKQMLSDCNGGQKQNGGH